MNIRVTYLSLMATCILASAPVMAAQPPIEGGLHFVGGTVHVNGKVLGKVWAVDAATGIRKTVVEIKADAGQDWPRDKRAKKVADNLKNEYDKNPKFYTALFRDLKDTYIVLRTDRNTPWIVTSDAESARLNKQNPTDYAETLKDVIRKVMSDPSVRDAPFDYQLTTPEQKRERAQMYRQMADDEFDADKVSPDLTRAEDLYLHALKLSDNDATIALRLVSAYIKDKNKAEAGKYFDTINRASLDDAEDQSSYDEMKIELQR